MLIDISPLISPKTAVWPGDVSFRRDTALDIADGHNITLSSVTSTVHIGAHADAPNHYHADGVDIASCALSPYYGPCQVIAVQCQRGTRIVPADLSCAITRPRVLFKTGSFPDPDDFNEDFNSLSPELIRHCHEAGVVLVGLDTPSVDPFDSKALESHQVLFETGMRNLEGLVLEQVAPGHYTLIALPLKIAGADASPVRAVLVSDSAPNSEAKA